MNLRSFTRFAWLAGLCCAIPALAVENTWLGSGLGDWHADPAANWSLGRLPAAGDEVVIANPGAVVVLSQSVPTADTLTAFTIGNGAKLVMTNWTTSLSATAITVQGNGTVTCAGPFTNAPAMSNRVWLICQDLTVDPNGAINVDAKGYAGAVSNNLVSGCGPGGGIGYGEGGAYGGFGGTGGKPDTTPRLWSRYPYGDPQSPLAPGSGGACVHTTVSAGAGGGAIRIEASGNVRVDGTISANGGNRFGTGGALQAGGGSGGGIYITCQTIDGTTGTISANGGDGQAYGGWGGGGRIAVVYDPAAQRNLPKPSINLSARPSRPASAHPTVYSALLGDLGTVYMPDTALLRNPINVSGQILMDVEAWSPDSLTIDNAWVRFAREGFKLTVTNDLIIRKGTTFGRMDVGGSALTNIWPKNSMYENVHFRRYDAVTAAVLTVGGNLILTNGAELVVYSAPTNGVAPEYGARVEVDGDLRIAIGSWVYPLAHGFNTGAPLFRARNLHVATNAGFNATWLGCGSAHPADGVGYGPGGGILSGSYRVGGSYGGLALLAASGKVYGCSNAPALPGSGASGDSNIQGGFGGGLIRLEVEKTCALLGTLRADGQKAFGGHVGGGSGGGIYVRCRTFVSGPQTVLQANGGLKAGSLGTGGGGGRIAVWRIWDSPPAVVVPSVLGADGSGNGSVVMGWLPRDQTLIILR